MEYAETDLTMDRVMLVFVELAAQHGMECQFQQTLGVGAWAGLRSLFINIPREDGDIQYTVRTREGLWFLELSSVGELQDLVDAQLAAVSINDPAPHGLGL